MRVLQFASGAWRQANSLQPAEARDLAYGPTHVWIRLEGLAQEKLEALGAVFNLHPLAIEDVRSHRQRPKVEDYDDLTFVVARAPRWNAERDELSWLTVGLFLGPDFLVTACTDAVAELDAVEKRLLAAKASPKSSSIDHVFYQVLDSIVDAYFPIMDDLEERIEALEEEVVVDEDPDHEDLGKLQALKQIVSQMRKTIFPMREAMAGLERGDHPNIHDETRIFLRDVSDHTTRLAERLDHVREQAILTQESYNASVQNYNSRLQNQINRVLKFLAGITFIMSVPLILSSIFGMNLSGIPAWDFKLVATGSLLAMVPLYVLARRKGWI